jgi:glycosyltransferase involved in cell wall biosynthesis
MATLKIAQVAPLYESVPPRFYGGTERVVSYLTEELVRQGHDVTLFASGDSVTAGHLRPCRELSMRGDPRCVDTVADHVLQLEQVFKHAPRFDVVHFHIDYFHFPLSRKAGIVQLTTLHGRLDLPDLQPLYDEFRDMPTVSISAAQRAPLPQARWLSTIPHGLPLGLYDFRATGGDYLAFVGRISPEKRVDRAVEIARRAGRRLRVAAKVDPRDEAYCREVAPLLSMPHVDFLGETDQAGKNALLGGAAAVLFPIDWPEPFGLVMIEALACGTPVVAFRGGAVEEIIEHGVTGFVVDSIEEAVAAVARAPELDRRACRKSFEERFTVERMARHYLTAYEALRAAS